MLPAFKNTIIFAVIRHPDLPLTSAGGATIAGERRRRLPETGKCSVQRFGPAVRKEESRLDHRPGKCDSLPSFAVQNGPVFERGLRASVCFLRRCPVS
jgi:hypothetical protein